MLSCAIDFECIDSTIKCNENVIKQQYNNNKHTIRQTATSRANDEAKAEVPNIAVPLVAT